MNLSHGALNPAPAATEPLVSVVMCAKNEEQHIGAAIESLTSQTYERLEIVVVDDCSSDGTGQIVRAFNDCRITFISNTTGTSGRASARNLGVRTARGEYITYQDADDISYPERIQRQVQRAVMSPNQLAVGTWIDMDRGSDLSVLRLPLDHSSIIKGFTRATRRVTFVSATMMYPSAIAKQVPQRPKFRYFEDWDMLCRLSESTSLEFCNIPEPLYRYILRKKGSKAQGDWADYNVFCRACHERRRAQLPEWESLEQFRKDQRMPLKERCRWGILRALLSAKGRLDMRKAG
ncbi:MAG TPA: glycosyltransferase family 2 protein [Terracidiphilus sp.]|nr:glycosyltransferase family 2 protein [Terracidiphilus sp.]